MGRWPTSAEGMTIYGKIFASMYDGSLRTKSPWQALVTFQQMIVLANKHGELDMTADALSFRTGIPLDIITPGIAALMEPDTDSRSEAEEGRRIVLMDPEGRNWGWRIVNYAHYRDMRNAEERREYMRVLMQERRATAKKSAKRQQKSPPVSDVNTPLAGVSDVSQGSKQYAEAKADTEVTASSSAREELLSMVPNRRAWEAEMRMTLDGGRKFAITEGQVEDACREYLGNGASANPNLRYFRTYLERASKPAKEPASQGDQFAALDKWAQENP